MPAAAITQPQLRLQPSPPRAIGLLHEPPLGGVRSATRPLLHEYAASSSSVASDVRAASRTNSWPRRSGLCGGAVHGPVTHTAGVAWSFSLNGDPCDNSGMGRAWMVVPPAAAAAAVWALRRRFRLITVTGKSMLPRLRPGQRVLVDLRARAVRPGDIVLVHSPVKYGIWRVPARRRRGDLGDYFIKRVAATGGDLMPAATGGNGVARVSEGDVILLGDGPNSLDSRALGACPVAAIVGVAVRVFD